jgi:formylglycine-generating enzyme required for sulfatase activity
MGAQKNHPDRPNYDPQADANERPVHEVTLSPYFLSKYEMTQGQWEGFTGENPSYYQNALLGPKPGLHPVEQVSWEDSQRVMGRLGLVLPTEAQWEYAARAGTTTPWSTGSERESLDGAANLADACCKENGGQTGWVYEEWLDDGFTVHGPVGSLSANGFGLHDVHGNVFEWCRDCSGDYSSPVAPGDGERRVSSRLRVSRGGSFIFTATSARSAFRNGDPPEGRYNFLGLRPARAIE